MNEASLILEPPPVSVTVPHNFIRRSYQWPSYYALVADGKKRLICVNHRRSGKDKNAWNTMIEEAFRRVGSYYYFLPTYSQARKIIWQGMDDNAFRFIDHIPVELMARKPLDDEMLIQLTNGSQIQLVGTDNIDRVVGTNPVGCVFSEYSLQNPRAWSYIEPILVANGGWAWFVFTPRGKNHAWKLYQAARENPDEWYVESLDITQTCNEAGERIITDEKIAQIRKEGREEAIVQQEYFCSFSIGQRGAYYTDLLERLESDGRNRGMYNPAFPVYTAWDLGVHDATSIWFAQRQGGRPVIVDCMEMRDVGLNIIIKRVLLKPYIYGGHFAPHDIKQRELSSGQTRLDVARTLGINFRVVPSVSVEDGIEASRRLLAMCEIDGKTCMGGLDALRNYRREYDEERMEYKTHPYHDWASNYSDAFRYLSLVIFQNLERKDLQNIKVDSTFSVWEN